jgi:hypothetical protein
MTHELDQERERKTTTLDIDRDTAVPGRRSASAALTGPTSWVASGLLMRKGAGDVAADAEGAVARASSGAAHELPGELRGKFEASLGADLAGVRVHTGAESQHAADAVGARAYATGNDIHFGAGQYDPHSHEGQALIAHEVAHTVQQRGGSPRRQHKLAVSSAGDAFEAEADRAASAMVSGAPTEILSVGGGSSSIARKTGDEAWWKLVMVQYTAFLKASGGDQVKALAQLKTQLGAAYPGDAAVIARAGGGAKPPAPPPAPDPDSCDPDNQTSDAKHPDPDVAPAQQDTAPTHDAEQGEKKEGEGGEKKEGPEAGVEVTPLKIGGFELGLKVEAEGLEIAVSQTFDLPSVSVPICAGVFLAFEPKVSVGGSVKYTKAGGWDGTLKLGFELGSYIKAGAPFANFFAGGKLNLDLSPHIAKTGFGELSGDVVGTLVIGAELKVPFQGEKLAEPEDWKKASGGLKFEMALSQDKYFHIVISRDGFKGTWIGPDLSARGNALQKWKEEYERNFAGGGASGAFPYGKEGPAQNQPDDGAGGSHG